jgi:hypothetical protein
MALSTPGREHACPVCGYPPVPGRTICPECGLDLECSWKDLSGTAPDLPLRRRADRWARAGCLLVIIAAAIAIAVLLLP